MSGPDWAELVAEAERDRAADQAQRRAAIPATLSYDPLPSFGTSISYGFNATVMDPTVPTTTSFVGRLGLALSRPVNRLAYPGATMNGGPEGQVSILAQMQSIPPPSGASVCLLDVGTNDAIAYDKGIAVAPGQPGYIADATAYWAAYSNGLTQGLLTVTSTRRIADPSQPRDALLARLGNIGTVPAGCSIFVGNACPQSTEHGATWVSGSNAKPATLTYVRSLTGNAVASVQGQGRRVFLVDLATAFDPLTQSTDGIHPNDAGHLLLYQLYYARMQAVGI